MLHRGNDHLRSLCSYASSYTPLLNPVTTFSSLLSHLSGTTILSRILGAGRQKENQTKKSRTWTQAASALFPSAVRGYFNRLLFYFSIFSHYQSVLVLVGLVTSRTWGLGVFSHWRAMLVLFWLTPSISLAS